MARSRNIKPSFFTNDTLAECPALARILFAGLWTIADREGRLEDRPKKIRAEVLPYDEFDCDSYLNLLADKGFIIRYKSSENQYIQIVNFQKHQNPHVKEAESTIPAPDKNSSSNSLNRNEPGLNPLTDSLNLIPLTLKPEPRALSVPNPFAVWYEKYPHKIGRAAAEKSFWKAMHHGTEEDLTEGLDRYIRSKPPDRPWCNPATWLNQQRWKDEPNELKGKNNGKSADEITREIAAEYYVSEPEDRSNQDAGVPKLQHFQ